MWPSADLRRLGLARLISRTGGEAAFFVGIWGRAAYDFAATPSQLALLMAVLGASAMAGSAASGVLVDRFGPRRVLLTGELLAAPAVLSLVLPQTMGQLTLAVAASGFFTMLVITAIVAFPPFIARGEVELLRANSLVEVTGTVGFIAGPAAGALLVAGPGLPWVFVFDAATSLVAVVLAARIRTVPQAASEDRGSALHELRDGFRFAYRHPQLRFLLALGTLTFLSFGAFGALEPLFFRDVLRTGPAALGWINTVFGIGLALGSGVLNRVPRRYATVRSVVALTAGGGIGALVYTGTSHLGVVVAGAVLWGAVLGALFPLLRSRAQLVTPARMQGRVAGLLEVQHNVGELLPLAFVPALAAAFGVQRVLVASGVVLLVAALSCWRRAGGFDTPVEAAAAPAPVALVPSVEAPAGVHPEGA